MNEDALKHLVTQGLHAMKAGSVIAERAQDDIESSASHPELKSALGEGKAMTTGWHERLDEALSAMSAGDGPDDNPVLSAHYEVATRIRGAAEDDTARDLGIVAAGQMALHYWMASFGTMAAYAKAIDMPDIASQMGGCLAEAKRADDAHSELAMKLLG